MARKATEPSLFLPGFGIDDDQAYPDLFTDSHSVTTTPLHNIGEPVGPVPTSRADLIATPRPWRPTTTREANQALVAWPQWQSSALEHLDGQAAKFSANLHAIAALRALEAADRAPSSGEREALLRFTGWGGIPASFNLDGYDPAWTERARTLRDLLTPSEYEAAKASVNNSHYTEPFIIQSIWAALRRLGFHGGRIAEPSSGVGHFIGCMPPDIATRSRITAVELDDVPGRILKALYGPLGVDVRIQGLENASLADGSFDLAISNVPFGTTKSATAATGPTAGSASTTGSSGEPWISFDQAAWCVSSPRPISSTNATKQRAPMRPRKPIW